VSANKKVVKVEIGGKEVELAVLRPNAKVRQDAQKVYNKAFRDAVESGAILRAKIESVMREQKLWDDAKEAELRKLQGQIAEKERKIRGGGIKLSEAREMAIQLRRDRGELRALNSERMSLDNNSCEAQADNAQFNFFVSACTVHANDGKPYFKSYEDYMRRSSTTLRTTTRRSCLKTSSFSSSSLPMTVFTSSTSRAGRSMPMADSLTKRAGTSTKPGNMWIGRGTGWTPMATIWWMKSPSWTMKETRF